MSVYAALRAQGVTASVAKKQAPLAEKAMRRGNITTQRRAAMFLATVGHESLSLIYRAEIGGKNTRYAPYYGRTFIQVTWRENYLAFGRWLGVGDLFVRKPWLLESDEYVWLGPVWFWTTRGLNGVADANDFRKVTRIVNGGYNGWSNRVWRYNQSKRHDCRPRKVNPFPGYTKDELNAIKNYDSWKKRNVNEDGRKRLRQWMEERRKTIWRAAQPKSEGGDGKGWHYLNRDKRYKSLKARSS